MASKAITAATTHYLQFDIQWSSLALLYYDYTLTFPMEVKYIWGQSFRLSTILYIFCRYALLANVLYLLAIANKLQHGSHSPNGPMLSSLGTSTFSFILALSERPRLAWISRTFRASAAWALRKTQRELGFLPYIAKLCSSLSASSADLLLSILMVVFEASSALLTIARCIQAFRVGGVSRHRGSLMHMIFEQGVLYFSIISLFTTAAVILNVKAPAGFFQRLLNAYTLPLSCLLTARFLLHLRAYDEKTKTVLSNPFKAPQNGGTLGTFRAAARGVYSTVVEPFGDDPVHVARSQSDPISGHHTDTIGGSDDNETRGDIATVRRKENDDSA
ncbi:hypothetical protein ONZ45_g390 [Pleurotus djamor]|nr:hypothetical protein ONZ45_g390 [Pleurotus djamor]